MSEATDENWSDQFFQNCKFEDEIDAFENLKLHTKEPDGSNGDNIDIDTNRFSTDTCQALHNLLDGLEKDSMTHEDEDEKKDKYTMLATNDTINAKASLKDQISQSPNATEEHHENVVAEPILTDKDTESDQLDSGKILRSKKTTPSSVISSDIKNRFGYVSVSSGANNTSENNCNIDNDNNFAKNDDVDTCCLRSHKEHSRSATNYTRSYRNSNIIYNFKTLCGEGGDACDIGQCCSEVTNTTHTKDRKSAIEFMVGNDYTELGGMNLYSSSGSHFIEITEPDTVYSSRMSLRHSDKLLAINNLSVDHYQHNIVLELLRYLVQSSLKEGTSLIVERQEQNGDSEILEIKVQAEITECEEAPIVKIKAEVCYSRTYSLDIKCVRLQSQFECKVNMTGTNLYVVTDKKKLHVRTLHNDDIRKSTFRCYEFSGVCMNRRGNSADPIFIGVFQSLDNDKYIMASSKSKLSLVSGDKINMSIDKIMRADARFFIVSKTERGQSFFESLLYRGSFWAPKGKVLELATATRRNVLRRQNSQFDLIPT